MKPRKTKANPKAKPIAKPSARRDSAQRKAQATRGRILDAAAATFRATGYAGTSLNDIAARARLQAGSLYYHFDSKETLLIEVLRIGLERIFTGVRQAVDALPQDAPFQARLRAAIGAHLAMLLRHGDYSSADIRIFGMVPAPVRRAHQPRRKAYGEYWRALLADGRAQGAVRPGLDLSLVRMLLLGAMNWATEWHKPGRGSVDAIAAALSDMVLRGLPPR